MQEKDDQLKDMYKMIEQLSVNPQVAKFKKEAKELSTLLINQQKIFCNKLILIQGQCKLGNSLVDQLNEMMNYFDEVNDQLTDFMNLQESREYGEAKLPKIDETQKTIIL